VVGLVGRDDGRVGGEREVDPREGDEVGLELVEVDVERAVEPERGRDRRDDLGNQPVEVGVGRRLDAEVTAADLVDAVWGESRRQMSAEGRQGWKRAMGSAGDVRLVVNHERAVRVLERGVGGEDRVVGLDDRVRDLRGRVDRELELRLLAVVGREALEEERTEAGAGSAAERVEDKEALETRAVVGEVADTVEDGVDEVLADRVVATGVVVGGVLLARDERLGVEERLVGASADLVNDVGLEVDLGEGRVRFGRGDQLGSSRPRGNGARRWGKDARRASAGRACPSQSR
jgi:hypothetical protein